jgi:hypothetical protein
MKSIRSLRFRVLGWRWGLTLRRHCFLLCEKQDIICAHRCIVYHVFRFFKVCHLLMLIMLLLFFSIVVVHHVVGVHLIVNVHHVVGVHLIVNVHCVVNVHHIVTSVYHGVDIFHVVSAFFFFFCC